MTDAYFHLPIHPRFQKYYRFEMEGIIYEFSAIPFGLATAPREFTEHAKAFKNIALTFGFRLNQYLDDWINRCLSKYEGQLSVVKLLHLLLYLGFVPNFPKCDLQPSQEFDFVGTRYQLQKGRVCPTEKRIESITKSIHKFETSRSRSVRQFMSLIGLLNSTFLQVKQVGRLHIRPIQWVLSRHWRHGQTYAKQISIPPSLAPHLRWWKSKTTLREGTSLHPPKHEIQVFTDASDAGWGAHCQGEEIQGTWSQEEQAKHINFLEMKTILIALKNFSTLLRGKVVLFLCDNSTTVWHLKKTGGVRVWPLYALTWLIFSKATKLGITILVRHIPGALNVIADRLSRKGQIQQSEWSLHPHVFHLICREMYTPMVDAFATADNTKLPLYISPIPDAKAYSVDAFSADWTGLCLYAYPPTKVLTETLKKIQAQPCRVLLIAPMWTSATWFWDLVFLSTDQPRTIPVGPKLLRQPGTPPVFDKNARMKALHVWTIDSTRTIDPDFKASPWLQDFETRRHNPPAFYAPGYDTSSNQPRDAKQIIMHWLKVDEL